MARDSVEAEHNVVYGTGAGEPELLDVHRVIKRSELRPAVVLIYGGGMWTGSRTEMEPSAKQLAHADYVWPAQRDDVQLTVRWVRAHAVDSGVGPTGVGASGWSAGDQLVALPGMRETRDPTAAISSNSSRATCVIALATDVDLAAYTLPPALHEVVALPVGTLR